MGFFPKNMFINVSLLLSLTNNGVCDPTIKDNLDCNYDLPDCENEHKASTTCPFLELHDKLSCQVATGILNTFPKCDNFRLCCEKGHLLNNGICNAEISGDFDCMYDAEDCANVGKQNELCQYAMKQSKLSCDIKNKVNLTYYHETFTKNTTIQAEFFSKEVKRRYVQSKKKCMTLHKLYYLAE